MSDHYDRYNGMEELLGTDCISRQAVIKEFSCCELTPDGGIDANYAIDFLNQLPSAQPEINCSEFPNNSDTISRQAVIEALYHVDEYNGRSVEAIRKLPPAQPEIIRCKDCKYARLTNDGSCKYCDIWFPDEAEYMDGDYYCASAERRTDE